MWRESNYFTINRYLLYNTPEPNKKKMDRVELLKGSLCTLFSTRHFSNQSCINFDVISFPFYWCFLIFLFLTFYHDIVNYCFVAQYPKVPSWEDGIKTRTKVKVEIHDAIKPSKSFASGNSLELFIIPYTIAIYTFSYFLCNLQSIRKQFLSLYIYINNVLYRC